MKVGHGGERSLRAPAKKESLEGAATCNLKGEHSVLGQEEGEIQHQYSSEGLLDCVHVSILGPAKTASLGGHKYFVSFVDCLSRYCWIYPLR